MRACVFTLGCKVNETESACIMASLESWAGRCATGFALRIYTF